ncbi:MAG: Hint domain-containing protein [Herpetosiphonaceae bacterium]|nr:Hint domain-containing protein [Herpetosiphonaceae bacterium]
MQCLRLLRLIGLLIGLAGCGDQTPATSVSQIVQPSAATATRTVGPSETPIPPTATLPRFSTIVIPGGTESTTLPATDISPIATAPPAPTSAPKPTDAGVSQLKFVLIDYFGGIGSERGIFYCDPDVFPVGIGREAEQKALDLFPTIQADADQFQAIARRLGLAQSGPFSDEQKLAIYREHKHLARVALEPADGSYRFYLLIFQFNGATNVTVAGTISASGTITILKQEAGGIFECPICLAEDTRIATPAGPIAVQSLRAGMLVWTQDASGARVAAPVLATSQVRVPATHRVVHLRLSDGRELFASPNHPTADGRTLGALQAGDRIDGGTVISAALIRYTAIATYDLLPAGDTGFYWADRVLLGSTLR